MGAPSLRLFESAPSSATDVVGIFQDYAAATAAAQPVLPSWRPHGRLPYAERGILDEYAARIEGFLLGEHVQVTELPAAQPRAQRPIRRFNPDDESGILTQSYQDHRKLGGQLFRTPLIGLGLRYKRHLTGEVEAIDLKRKELIIRPTRAFFGSDRFWVSVLGEDQQTPLIDVAIL